MSGAKFAKKWIIFWSLFYGIGAPLFQILYFRQNGIVNQFTFADFVTSAAMLISVLLLYKRKSVGLLLNATSWGAFLTIFLSALTYFYFFLKEETPQEAVIVTAVGLLISVTCIAIHIRWREELGSA